MKRLDELKEKLADSRSGRILFVSHCLLNVNARYLGGAFRRGSVDEVVDEAKSKGYGIVQIPCPEIRAWGGALKKTMWLAFGIKGKPVYVLRGLLIPAFGFYTHMRYNRIAASLAKEIRDYARSGYAIAGIVGVDGSPSCGVNTRLGLKASCEYLACCKAGGLDREAFNRGLYEQCSENGSGIFIEELKKHLKKRKLNVPVFAHSLVSEMNGEKSKIEFI